MAQTPTVPEESRSPRSVISVSGPTRMTYPLEEHEAIARRTSTNGRLAAWHAGR